MDKCKYLILTILLSCFCHDIQGRGYIEFETEYGQVNLSDDDQTSIFLNWLATPSGICKIDSTNTVILIGICGIADGALGEIVDYHCMNDFISKPDIILRLLRDNDISYFYKYIDNIAYGFVVDAPSVDLEQILYRIKNKIIDEGTGKIEKDKIEQFSSRLRDRYNYFIVNQ